VDHLYIRSTEIGKSRTRFDLAEITEQAEAAHLERVPAAIRSAAQVPGNPVADALAAAIGRQQGRERLVRRKCKREEEQAARRQEEEAVISTLYVELRALQTSEPHMSLLTAVEFITPDPAHRVVLYPLYP
jgi:hypothetical protein